MYEHGIAVTYRLLQDEPTGPESTRVVFSEPATVELPGWCAGEPRLAVALYLFGSRDYEGQVWLDDWQPLDEQDAAIERLRGMRITTEHSLYEDRFGRDDEDVVPERWRFDG